MGRGVTRVTGVTRGDGTELQIAYLRNRFQPQVSLNQDRRKGYFLAIVQYLSCGNFGNGSNA